MRGLFNKWDALHFAEGLVAKNSDEVLGVVLFQLPDAHKLKMEAFSSKTGGQVSGFTDAALVYER